MPTARLLISGLIVFLLLAKATTFVWGTQVWPVMAYCMYAYPRPAPPRTQERDIQAELAGDRTVTLTAGRMGMSYFAWRDHYVRPLLNEEAGAAERIARHASRNLDAPVRAVLLIDHRYELQDGELKHERRQRRYEIDPSALEPSAEDDPPATQPTGPGASPDARGAEPGSGCGGAIGCGRDMARSGHTR